MNLYVTLNDKFKLKKCFLNLRKQQLIIVDEIVSSLGYDIDSIDDYSYFIINQKIKKIISTTAGGRKMQSIIYVNPSLTEATIIDLVNFCNEETLIEKVIFLTDKHTNEDYYQFFDEILFFPAIKKVQIFDCKSLPIEWVDESFR